MSVSFPVGNTREEDLIFFTFIFNHHGCICPGSVERQNIIGQKHAAEETAYFPADRKQSKEMMSRWMKYNTEAVGQSSCTDVSNRLLSSSRELKIDQSPGTTDMTQ